MVLRLMICGMLPMPRGSWVKEGIYVHPTERTGLDTAITVDANDSIHIAHRNTISSGNLYCIKQFRVISQPHQHAQHYRCFDMLLTFLPTGLGVEDGTYAISVPTIHLSQRYSYHYCNLIYRFVIYWAVLS